MREVFMLKAGLKAIDSINKAGKIKSAGDILKATGDTAKAVSKITKKKAKKKNCKC